MKSRLIIATVLLAGLVIILNVAHYFAATTAGDNTKMVTNDRIPQLLTLQDMRFGVVRIISSTTEYVLLVVTGSETDERDKELNLIEKGKAIFTKSMRRHAKIRHTAGAVADPFAVQLSELYEKLSKAADDLIGSADRGANFNDIKELKEAFEEREQEILDIIDTHLAVNFERAEAGLKDTTLAIRRTQNFAITIGGIALASFIIYGIFVFNMIHNLAMARENAEVATRAKSEFLATVSHELRTPLTSIKGSLRLVAGGNLGALPEKAKGMVDIAQRNTERLINLVNEILDMETLDSGRMEFDMQPLDLSDLVTEVVANNKGFANEHDVKFVLADLAPEVTVRGDSTSLTQVVANLLSNASKFSPKSGKVEISVTRHDGMARVSITDHGSGIPEEYREQIFEKFFQADSSDTRQVGGTGLGLSITKSIIEKHGGAIGFDSEVGVGSTFFFTLPV